MTAVNKITEWISRNIDNGFIGKSNYLEIDNVLVRISNHLPNINNIEAYNEDVEKVLLVFFSNDVSESEITNFIDSEMRDYDAEYIIIEENSLSDYDKEVVIKRFI